MVTLGELLTIIIVASMGILILMGQSEIKDLLRKSDTEK